MGFPVGSVVKYPPAIARDTGGWFDPWVGKIPWRRKWQPILVFMPGKPHGQRSLASYGPWGSLGNNTRMGCHFLLQGNLWAQELNPHLLCLLGLADGFFTTKPPEKLRYPSVDK